MQPDFPSAPSDKQVFQVTGLVVHACISVTMGPGLPRQGHSLCTVALDFVWGGVGDLEGSGGNSEPNNAEHPPGPHSLVPRTCIKCLLLSVRHTIQGGFDLAVTWLRHVRSRKGLDLVVSLGSDRIWLQKLCQLLDNPWQVHSRGCQNYGVSYFWVQMHCVRSSCQRYRGIGKKKWSYTAILMSQDSVFACY